MQEKHFQVGGDRIQAPINLTFELIGNITCVAHGSMITSAQYLAHASMPPF
jgi:hypothetical protein